MRIRLLRDLGVSAAALLLLTSCSSGEPEATTTTLAPPSVTPSAEPSDDSSVPDLTEESCGEIVAALGGVDEATSAATKDITAAPEAFAQVAANLRAAATGAQAEIAIATEEAASAIDDIVAKLRAGDIFNLSFSGLDQPIERLYQLCRS